MTMGHNSLCMSVRNKFPLIERGDTITHSWGALGSQIITSKSGISQLVNAIERLGND